MLDEAFIAGERKAIARLYLPALRTKVACEDGRIAGFICLNRDEVAALFVHPDFQGQGLGKRLLSAFHPPLTVEVFEANRRGREFYEGFGFRATGRRIHEEAASPLICMVLDAPPAQPLYPGDGQERRQ